MLESLRHGGLTIEPVAGTPKMRIRVPAVKAASAAEGATKALDQVRSLVPATGYKLSEPEPLEAAPPEPVAV